MALGVSLDNAHLLHKHHKLVENTRSICGKAYGTRAAGVEEFGFELGQLTRLRAQEVEDARHDGRDERMTSRALACYEPHGVVLCLALVVLESLRH